MRPYWKGYLKLALVSCPIALHAACSSAERIALRQINKATGNRLRQQLIDEETREPVAPEHKGRGYEVAKGQRSEEHTSELQSHSDLVCRLLLEKKKKKKKKTSEIIKNTRQQPAHIQHQT